MMQQNRWRCRAVTVMLSLMWGLLMPGYGFAAETVAGSPTKTTQVILTLDTRETIRIRTHREAQPPSIVLEFPGQQVSGSLPERFVIQHGVISEIRTHYRTPKGRTPMRVIDSLHIGLTGPYTQRIHTEPGHIIIDIDHPVGVTGETVEIRLRGGTILSGLARRTITDRFRAMQEALVKASPTTGMWRATPFSGFERGPGRRGRAPRRVARPTKTGLPVAPQQTPQPRSTPERGTFPWTPLVATMVALLGAGAALWWFRGRPWAVTPSRWAAASPRPVSSSASGTTLIEQLVWRTFERRGYQLIQTVEVAQPRGTMHVIAKEGAKHALLYLGNGPFFEKKTVEECIQAMHQASMDRGFIVASGSFTVPAQRSAKEAHVTLIGREELAELLSTGATTEHFEKQLEGLHARLDESKDTVKRYAHELEAIRRRRNEASWSLGEERARRAKLETEAAELSRQLHHIETRGGPSQGETAELRKQWEESQWYLGEAKARIRYLEEQVSQLQEVAQRVESTRRGRDEAQRSLGEERLHREQLGAQLQALTTEVKQAVMRERALQDQMERLKEEPNVLQAHGERRKMARSNVSEATVELRDRRNRLIYSGGMRDLSGTGMGFDSERTSSIGDPLRISLRLPGRSTPITSRGQLVWQRKDPRTTRYRNGCRFVGLSSAKRARIEQILEPMQS